MFSDPSVGRSWIFYDSAHHYLVDLILFRYHLESHLTVDSADVNRTILASFSKNFNLIIVSFIQEKHIEPHSEQDIFEVFEFRK